MDAVRGAPCARAGHHGVAAAQLGDAEDARDIGQGRAGHVLEGSSRRRQVFKRAPQIDRGLAGGEAARVHRDAVGFEAEPEIGGERLGIVVAVADIERRRVEGALVARPGGVIGQLDGEVAALDIERDPAPGFDL